MTCSRPQQTAQTRVFFTSSIKPFLYEPHCEKKRSLGFPTRYNICWATQGLKFRINGLYYPCNENKGYRVADLCLCFLIYAKTQFSHDAAHITQLIYTLSLLFRL